MLFLPLDARDVQSDIPLLGVCPRPLHHKGPTRLVQHKKKKPKTKRTDERLRVSVPVPAEVRLGPSSLAGFDPLSPLPDVPGTLLSSGRLREAETGGQGLLPEEPLCQDGGV